MPLTQRAARAFFPLFSLDWVRTFDTPFDISKQGSEQGKEREQPTFGDIIKFKGGPGRVRAMAEKKPNGRHGGTSNFLWTFMSDQEFFRDDGQGPPERLAGVRKQALFLQRAAEQVREAFRRVFKRFPTQPHFGGRATPISWAGRSRPRCRNWWDLTGHQGRIGKKLRDVDGCDTSSPSRNGQTIGRGRSSTFKKPHGP